MFQRYTETARRVIFFARYEASQFGSPYIETEHLLLGILREAPEISKDLALEPDTAIGIRRRIEASVVPGPKEPIGIDLPLSHAAKIALARAAEEADRLNHTHIAPIHLLVALMRDEESLASEILKSHGIELPQVRELLAKQPADEAVAPAPDWLPPPPPPPGTGGTGAVKFELVSSEALRAMYTAGTLRLGDFVMGAAKSVDELAAATHHDPTSLASLLTILTGYGVFNEVEPRKFVITPLGRTLIA